MPDSLFLLFNHEITPDQKRDAQVSLGVARIVDLPDNLKRIWRDIPPDSASIRAYLAPLQEWLGGCAVKGDYALIQGDFGACYLMVNFCFESGLIPVYSTTRRMAVERLDRDGSIRLTHRFSHRIFRKYGV